MSGDPNATLGDPTVAPAVGAGDPAVSLGDAVVPLLRGVVYRASQPRAWTAITRFEPQVRDYVKVMNLDVTVDTGDGFAYLRRRADIEPGEANLIRRRALTYRQSLILVLLRGQLLTLDQQQGDQTRLVMSRADIVDLVRTFHPVFADDAKLLRQVDADVQSLTSLGFLRHVRGQDDQVEVMRIIKAFVDAEFLTDVAERIEGYRRAADGLADDTTTTTTTSGSGSGEPSDTSENEDGGPQ